MLEPVDTPISTVIIVGAGLGGLMLGAILETANISYHILERASELRPFGSAISMSGNTFPLFEQLEIYEELKSVSLPGISMEIYDTKLNALGSAYSKEHNMVMGKKVLRTKEHDNKVTVYYSDNTEYECRILVGADGAYSSIRQNIYKMLERHGRLPSIDKEAFSIGYITMVGVSKPTNPEKYPQLAEKHRAYFRVTVGDNNDSNKAKDLHFRNSEWGPESIDYILGQFQDFPCAFGGTMKEIFDATPKNLISKVFLEEKAFQTWYNGRSVLIGDGNVKL
ncbi:hypothetical protein BGZ79_007722 [Entomortierella chlamydospora]|nr:hypothetical protein BGZ79_007722 [Entomortierella chlamydospora]